MGLAGAVHALEFVLCAFPKVVNGVCSDCSSGCHECENDELIYGGMCQACLGCELTIGCPFVRPDSGS